LPWSNARPKGKGLKRKRTINGEPKIDADSFDADSLHCHILSDNEKRKDGKYRKDGKCYLCEIMGADKTGSDTKSSKMGCFQCGHCYHLRCFNMMHHRHLNSSNFNDAMDLAIQGSKRKRPWTGTVTNPTNQGGIIPVTAERLEM
jgi:hypothetical protein